MKVLCSYTELVLLENLKPNPKNNNTHTDRQIELLAKIMKHDAVRHPIIVSRRSGFINSGHARLMAAKLNGWPHFPVDFQDFNSDAEEYFAMTADNTIAELSKTNMDKVREDALEFPELDMELLGLVNLTTTVPEDFKPEDHWKGMPEFDNEDLRAERQIIVSFKTDSDVHEFSKLIKQDLTDKTKSIWFPEVQNEKAVDKRY